MVTVEEVVETFDAGPNAVILPHWIISAIAVAPGGAKPSYAQGYYKRSNAYYLDWNEISSDRARFQAWLEDHVFHCDGRELPTATKSLT